MSFHKVKIGKAELLKLVLVSGGNLTLNGDGENLDRSKLDFGGLDIEKDGRSYWCDTSFCRVNYDPEKDLTTIHLDLHDDPEVADATYKQDLTEEDLHNDPEYYLWMEYEGEFKPNQTLIIISGGLVHALDMDKSTGGKK